RDELLIIRCSKQDKDDENESSDADVKSKEYLIRLMDSKLFEKTKSVDIKQKIGKMLDGARSQRYPLTNQLLRSANMVFSTTNSEQVERMIRGKAQFDWSIMEETGKVTGIELLSPLLLSHRRLMIGDHKQLPPYRSTETRAVLADVDKLKTVLQESEQISNSRIKGEAVKSMLEEKFPNDEKIREMGVGAMRNLMLFETLVKDEQSEATAYK
ncbi:AAA domain-containing protein, partial [Pseudomonas viridiflava]|uniref:AAA domain-containing protein n=1 Tax=Pseudomonas viridiflava TaxID=33069 RepID=UPI002405A2B8